MERNKLLQIKEYNNNITNIIDDLLLIKKNKGVQKITQSFDSSVGPNILEKYNIIPEIPEVIPTEEKYKIVETIKKAEKAGNWSLVSKLATLLLSISSPPADSLKHQPSIKPLEMQYTSTAGEHNDKYNEQVFNDANIENLTINEVLEEPPVKAMMFDADLKAQKKKLKKTNKPLMFDADLKAQKKRLKKTKEDEGAIAKIEEELIPWWDKKKEKKEKKPEKTTAQIEEELIPWWDKKKIKKLNIEEDTMTELLDMIKTLKNTNIEEINKTKEKEINKKIKKIEKFINNPELKPTEPKKKTKKINEIEEAKPEPKKEKKTKTVYDPKKIEKNKQLINDYTFNDKMSDRFLTDGAKELEFLKKNKGTDEDVSDFSIVYLQKEPNGDEIEELREIFKIKQK